jgi:hypothetical protein
MKIEQARLTNQLEIVDRKLSRLRRTLGDLTVHLDRALAYLQGLDLTYRSAKQAQRRQINQAMFTRIEIGDDDTVEVVPDQLYGALLNPDLGVAARTYVAKTHEQAQNNEQRRRSRGTAALTSVQLRSFLHFARSAGV